MIRRLQGPSWVRITICAIISAYIYAFSFASILSNNNPVDSASRSLSVSKFRKGNHQVNETSRPRRTTITFVNGIYHSLSECQDIATEMQKIFKEEVRPFYNPSTGKWLADLTYAGMDLMRRPDDHATARDLARHLKKVRPNNDSTSVYKLKAMRLCPF
jgi:hypothetical protein